MPSSFGSGLLGSLSVCVLSGVQLFAIPRTVAHQAPPSMELSGPEYWSGLSFPSLRDLPDPGLKPVSLVSPALAGRFFTTKPPGKPIGQCSGMHKYTILSLNIPMKSTWGSV